MKQIILFGVTICALFFLSCNQATNPDNGSGTGGTANQTPFLGKWQSDFSLAGPNTDPVNFHASISFDSLGKYEFIMTAVASNETAKRKGTFTYDTDKIYCKVLEVEGVQTIEPFEFDYSLNNNILHLDSGFSNGYYTKQVN